MVWGLRGERGGFVVGSVCSVRGRDCCSCDGIVDELKVFHVWDVNVEINGDGV